MSLGDYLNDPWLLDSFSLFSSGVRAEEAERNQGTSISEVGVQGREK